MTLPLLLTLKRCTSAERDAVEAVLKAASNRLAELQAEGRVTPEAVIAPRYLALVLELVERHRGVADTNRRAEQHVARARRCHRALPRLSRQGGLARGR